MEESQIIRWMQIISDYLKVIIEPTAALGIAGCNQFLQNSQDKKLKILIILSGGNMSEETRKLVWEKNYLATISFI